MTAFVDVNVVPMDTERVLPRQTVLVDGGRITALGPVDQVPVPTGAVRIDGRGKYLMPGLADMHAHLAALNDGEHRLFSYLAHGVTTVRHVDFGHDRLLRFTTADILRPRLYLAPPIREQDLKSMRLDSVAAQVAAFKAAGYNFLSVRADYVRLPSEERVFFDSLVVAARRLGLPVSSHTNAESFEDMLAIGAYGGSVEHLYAFREILARPAASVSESEIRALAAATQRAGAWVTVTLDCTEYNGKPRGSNLGLARRLVKALQDAGAGLLLGSDANGGVGVSASIVHTELASLVRAGLSPYQALRIGTRNVAQYLGQLDSSGTVAVGKRADLVLLSGNPLEDIRHAREPAGVMIAGRWLDRAVLDQGLLASPKSWLQMEIQFGIMPRTTDEQKMELRKGHYRKFEALTDSLELMKPLGPAGARAQQRVRQLLAEELGGMRATLTPEQRDAFDPQARVWLREQARQGYPVTVPGFTAVP